MNQKRLKFESFHIFTFFKATMTAYCLVLKHILTTIPIW